MNEHELEIIKIGNKIWKDTDILRDRADKSPWMHSTNQYILFHFSCSWSLQNFLHLEIFYSDNQGNVELQHLRKRYLDETQKHIGNEETFGESAQCLRLIWFCNSTYHRLYALPLPWQKNQKLQSLPCFPCSWFPDSIFCLELFHSKGKGNINMLNLWPRFEKLQLNNNVEKPSQSEASHYWMIHAFV